MELHRFTIVFCPARVMSPGWVKGLTTRLEDAHLKHLPIYTMEGTSRLLARCCRHMPYARPVVKEMDMTEAQDSAMWNVAEWHGKMLFDVAGEKLGKLQDVYVDVATDEPQFATVKEGVIGRHLTFVPLAGIQIGPDSLQTQVTKDQVRSAPEIEMHGDELSQADESSLYHHFEMNYTPIDTQSGRRLARR